MEVAEKKMIDVIQEQYLKLKSKTKFIKMLSDNPKIDRAPKTLRNHWFSEFWAIPLEFQSIVLEEINKELEIQKSAA